MEKLSLILYWSARVIAAIIMLQTLFFKFSGSPETVFIFTKIGLEPWGRIGIGVLELIAAILLLINPAAWLGGCLALGLMSGAILMHLTTLGILVQEDGGYLFFLALIVALCSIFVVSKNKGKLLALAKLSLQF